MDRHWLLTWTCYGTRLPGSPFGFVCNVREADGMQVVHNIPGTPCDANMPRLEAWVEKQMKGEPVSLSLAEANALIVQYQETSRARGWRLEAASVMSNHTHLVAGVVGDPDPQSVLETFKSWATRAVKKIRPLPSNGTFWTAKGSKRKLPDDPAVCTAVVYVARKQPEPLATWWAPEWQATLDAFDVAIALASR